MRPHTRQTHNISIDVYVDSFNIQVDSRYFSYLAEKLQGYVVYQSMILFV